MSFKNQKKAYSKKRDDPQGAVLVVPHYVLNSTAYRTLSGNGVRLLYDIAMQYNTRNNGCLLASFRHMREKRGWRSSDSLNKAVNELIERNLICKTVQGRMPNKASWYAICWASLDDIKNLDIASHGFPRGAYAHWQPSEGESKKRKPPNKTPVIDHKRLEIKATNTLLTVDAKCPTPGLNHLNIDPINGKGMVAIGSINESIEPLKVFNHVRISNTF